MKNEIENSTGQFLVYKAEDGTVKIDVRRKQVLYNLDAIISVGYRIKSHVATRFRIWATERLKEYIVKGFTLDDERLKNPDLPFDSANRQYKNVVL